MANLQLALGFLAAYFIGAIPASFLICKFGFGVDLRTVGSGNVGATNALRALGPKAGVPALLCDSLKGTLATLLALYFLPPQAPLSAFAYQLACGVMAVLGHSFTVFLKFKGGKGVATAAGVFASLAPRPLLLTLVVFGIVVGISGYVSLGSILSALSFPIWIYLLIDHDRVVLLAISTLLALFIVLRHRANIGRILDGTESSFRKPPTPPTGGEQNG